MLKDTKLYGSYQGNDNYCTGYINKATFDEIQQILDGRNIKTQCSNRVHIFSSLIKCPHCGTNLTGTCSNKRTYKRPSGKIYTYKLDIKSYRCNKYAVSKMCDYYKRINEKHLEEALLNNLDDYVESYLKANEIADARTDADTDLIMKRITAIKSEMTKVKRMYRKEDISEAEYDSEMAELKAELIKMEGRLKPKKERKIGI